MPGLLKRSLKINTFLILTAAAGSLLMREPLFGAGILVAGIWSTANFLLTLSLFKIALLRSPKTKLLLLLLIKFPVLYLLGFLVLALKAFPVLSLVLGMSSILLVLGVSSIWPKQGTSSTNCRT